MCTKIQIRNGTLFDGKSGTAVKNEVIEVENEVWTTSEGLQKRPQDTDRIYNDAELTAIDEEARMAGMVVPSGLSQ